MFLSVCIPVYNGERYLSRCLESLARQTYRDFEVIVVDDCSPGTDEHGWHCRKICRKMARQTGMDITCRENRRNRGSMESRRSAVYEARGDYVLCVDCDDQLESRALELLVQKAAETGADIVQCGTRVVFETPAADVAQSAPQAAAPADVAQPAPQAAAPADVAQPAPQAAAPADTAQPAQSAQSDGVDRDGIWAAANLLIPGEVTGQAILNGIVIDAKINYFIWGKLIRRAVFTKAFERIPPMYGVWAEDYLMLFFIAYYAEKYVGIKDALYVYTGDSGISNTRDITDLKKWEKFCAVTSIFATIFMLADDGNITLTKEQRAAVQKKCDMLVSLNIVYLSHYVSEDIRPEARAMLIDYSGEAYIRELEQMLTDGMQK